MASESFAVGVDVGGTNTRVARIAVSGEILDWTSCATSPDPDTALSNIKRLVAQLGGNQARAIGAGIPGRVDGWTGQVLSGGYLDLSGVDLKAELTSAFGCPVLVANDCSMALVGEHRRGAAKGLDNVAMMTIGTGIGGAAMERGRILNGKRCAGQFGHLVVSQQGQLCNCGQRGCVETESSGTSLRRHLNEAGYSPETRFEHVYDSAKSGDAKAISVMIAWSGPLRSAINTLSAGFDPDVVLLGGGMGQAALKAMEFLPKVRCWYDIEVRGALLGDDAGVIGAGLAAYDLSVPKPGKRLVMVNGVPASGKSHVASRISGETGWPMLALDTIKNPFLELIEGVDRPFNRVLGRASYKAIFATIRDAAPGTTFVVDAWFGFQPEETLLGHLEMAGVTEIAEVWCFARPDVIGDRFMQRADSRLPGHPGKAYVPELIELAKRARPMALGPVLAVDTEQPLDGAVLLNWIASTFCDRGRQLGSV